MRAASTTFLRLLSMALALSLLALLVGCDNSESTSSADDLSAAETQESPEDQIALDAVEIIPELKGDLVIPLSGVSPIATFYPVKVDGVKMEVLVVEASDGTIRTAFNTCEVCYLTGLGYYVQEGDTLICQNCKNVFEIDKVGNAGRGACHPYSIFEEERQIDEENVTIPYALIKDTKDVFLGWEAEAAAEAAEADAS